MLEHGDQVWILAGRDTRSGWVVTVDDDDGVVGGGVRVDVDTLLLVEAGVWCGGGEVPAGFFLSAVIVGVALDGRPARDAACDDASHGGGGAEGGVGAGAGSGAGSRFRCAAWWWRGGRLWRSGIVAVWCGWCGCCCRGRECVARARPAAGSR